MDSEGFFQSFMDRLSSLFNSLSDAIDLLADSAELPMRLSSYMPTVIGASITIVLFTMVIKFILGR